MTDPRIIDLIAADLAERRALPQRGPAAITDEFVRDYLGQVYEGLLDQLILVRRAIETIDGQTRPPQLPEGTDETDPRYQRGFEDGKTAAYPGNFDTVYVTGWLTGYVEGGGTSWESARTARQSMILTRRGIEDRAKANAALAEMRRTKP